MRPVSHGRHRFYRVRIGSGWRRWSQAVRVGGATARAARARSGANPLVRALLEARAAGARG
ncbi:hypothetical protein HMPREF1550_01844 [Actinomyces sp. oral taxon 877 str. F0543]|nr:hypothetical protein HMPREF1550_01844 [Actinomyces sp. oral taxon 877 str. F0543]